MEPKEWIREELAYLWGDFFIEEQRSQAGAGNYSTGMEHTLERIQSATAIVGPVSWMNIGTLHLANGSYRRACEEHGIPYTFPTDEEYDKYVKPHWGERRN